MDFNCAYNIQYVDFLVEWKWLSGSNNKKEKRKKSTMKA